MSDDRTVEVIMAAWRQCWTVTPEKDREEAIELMTSKPHGKYHDMDERVAAVGRLVEWRQAQGVAEDEVARLAVEDAFAAGLYRYLTFLKMAERAAVGTDLLNGERVQ